MDTSEAPRHRGALRRGVVALLVALTVLVSLLTLPVTAEAEPPRTLPRGVEAHLGLQYADLPGDAGTLDLFLPTKGEGPFPVVLWTAGSGWTSDQGNIGGERVAAHLAPRGYAVISYSIRSSSQAVFPAQLHDAKAAVRWVRAHAEELGIDPDRIAAAGDSSGGWASLMLGLTGGDPALEGRVGETVASSEVQAVVDFYAPTDFLRINEQMLPGACGEFNRVHRLTGCHDDPAAFESRLLGGWLRSRPELAAVASPLTYADAGDPPVLITHGTHDWVVPAAQSDLLFTALDRAGAPVVQYTVAGAGHSLAYASPGQGGFTTTTSAHLDSVTSAEEGFSWDTVADFLDAELGK